MRRMTRRQALRLIVGGGGLFGLGIAAGCGRTRSGDGLSGGMMGSATAADRSTSVERFDRHRELRRRVELVPGGVRTVTESDSPELAAKLQAHVGSMYEHLQQGAEVSCMSASLPSLFRNAKRYRRTLAITPKGVAVTEIARDPRLARAIREHAREVTGFVREGMPAMMRGMMG